MRISPVGIDLIKSFESCKLIAYLDGNDVLTNGWGHTRGVTPGVITQAQADANLLDDLQDAENAVTRLVGVPVNQNQFDALVSFTFNMGQGRLASSTLLCKLNAQDYAGAKEQFNVWIIVAGQICDGLKHRRAAEAALFSKAVSV